MQLLRDTTYFYDRLQTSMQKLANKEWTQGITELLFDLTAF